MRLSKLSLPLLLLLSVACSTNPATGKREFNIVSEQQEISMGQESHQQIIRQFGTYDEKPELSRLVETVGRRVAAESDRPNLPWHFTLLDTPMVNAMALPGGYIYITRGMMERINSEEELAGVLGHEIAHVTARHAAQRISRAQLAQFGMVVGAVVAGPAAAQQYGQLAELGVALLFQRYSRAQESQADIFGTQYMAEARYNPIGAERMLMTLQRMQRQEMSSIDRYFASHPDPSKRVREVRAKVQELAQRDAAIVASPLDRTRYVRMLEGMITANSTEEMVIRDGVVYDRGHGLIIRAPSGWVPTLAPGMLFAMAPRNSRANTAFMAQEVDVRELQGPNAQTAVRVRLEQMGLTYAGSRQVSSASGEAFTIDVWSGQTESGAVGVETTQFTHGDHVAVFIFLSPSLSRSVSPLGDILSRAVIDRARARSVEPPRIRIGTVRSGGESWIDLSRRATGSTAHARSLANMNGFDLQTPPESGMLVKLPQEIVEEES